MKLVPPALVPTKVGGSKKQTIVLGVLLVILPIVYFLNRDSSTPGVEPAPRSALNVSPIAKTAPSRPDSPSPAVPQRQGSRSGGGLKPVEDFRPTLKLKEGTDISRIDPTLKLDLLAKVNNVAMEGGVRSLFAFGAPPAPPPPPVSAIKPGPLNAAANNTPPPPKPANLAPLTPAAPPIPLKFYGYANAPKGGPQRAFFLNGDDIYVAGENDMILSRYKIVRIGVNSAVVEDTTNKNQQTLPLVEELAG